MKKTTTTPEAEEPSVMEKSQQALERLKAGEATDDDYMLVGQVSMAAIELMQKSASADSDAGDGDESEDDDTDTDDDESEEDDDVEKSVRTEVEEEDEEDAPLFKSMLEAAEEAGAGDAEEYMDAEPIMKSIALGMDVILAEVKKLGKRVGNLEKSIKAAPAKPAATEDKPAASELLKSQQAATAERFEEVLKGLEGRQTALENMLSGRPFSPHPNGMNKSASNGNGHDRSGVNAASEETCLNALEKALDKGEISTEQASRAADLIGANRDQPPAEMVRKAAPDAMPILKSLHEARF